MVQLNTVIKRGVKLINRFPRTFKSFPKETERLWRSFSRWNGFSHIHSLLSSGVAEFLCNFVQQPVSDAVSFTGTILSFFQREEVRCFREESFLKTVCVICNALMHFNFTSHSKFLAKAAALGYLRATGTNISIDADRNGSKNLLEALRELCHLKTMSLWPPPSGDFLPPLLLLWQIITKLDADVWKDTSFKVEGSLFEKHKDTELSWIVYFALKCLTQRSEKIFTDQNEVEYVNEVSVSLAHRKYAIGNVVHRLG